MKIYPQGLFRIEGCCFVFLTQHLGGARPRVWGAASGKGDLTVQSEEPLGKVVLGFPPLLRCLLTGLQGFQ